MNRRNNNKKEKEISGLSVEVRNGDFARALRRFKKLVQDDGILQELRKREYFEKPSAKRKRMKAAARARHLKAMQKRKDQLGY